ncbi:MAG TPA: DedA family protein [Baekduia sp.]
MIVPVSAHLGYPALGALILGESAGLPLPGETALIVAGGLAASGQLSLPAVIAVGALAAIAGDNLGYVVGRRGGRAFLLRDGVGARHRRHAVRRAEAFFARFGTAAVFCGRWVAGVRIVTALVAGAARMPWRRFAWINAAAAIAWAATIATLARLVGPTGSLLFAAAALAVAGIAGSVQWARGARRVTTGAPR